MAERVNRVPQGLIPLLQLKTGGVTPPAVSDLLAGTIDLTDFYATNRYEMQAVFNNTANAVGNVATLTVPESEFWLVYSASGILIQQNNNDAGAVVVQVKLGSNVNPVMLGQSPNVTFPALANNSNVSAVSNGLPRPLLLRSGDLVEAEITELTLGGATITVGVKALVAAFGPATG